MSSGLKPSAGDVWGAVAATLVALPQALAFGVAIYSPLGAELAAQGAVAGLLGAVAMGLFAPALGGAPRLVSAPCAPAAALLATLALSLAPLGPERAALLLAAVGLGAGLLQIAFGLAGGGRLIKYIPYPVVTGYLSAVAILIVLSQGPLLFGLPKGTKLGRGLLNPGAWQVPALFVAAATMAAMTAALRWVRRVPAPVVGLAAGFLAYAALALFYPALQTLDGNSLVVGRLGGGGSGAAASRFAALSALSWADLRLALAPAATLAVLLSMDTLKTCVVVDALTRGRHDSNRELLGQGAGNLASALIGGIPGAGTMAATLVNVGSGASGKASGLLVGVFSAVVFLLLSGVVAWVPLAALAGMLTVMAFRMFDWHSFRLLSRESTRLDVAVAATVVSVAVASDLIRAAGVGLALAILLFIRDLISSSVVRRKLSGEQMASKQKRLPEELDILRRESGRTVLFELQGSLFFGTADQFYSEAEGELGSRRWIILDMRHVLSVDFTAAHILEMLESRLAERGGRLLLAGIPKALPTGQDLAAYLGHVGLVREGQGALIFADSEEALSWVEERILEEFLPSVPASAPPLPLEEIGLLRGLEPELLKALRGLVSERRLEPGERVFSQGQPGEEMFFVRKGRVKVSLELAGGKAYHLATFRRGDFFGEMAFLDKGNRSAAAAALVPTELFALSRDRFDAEARAHGDLGRKFFWRVARGLALRVRQADAEIRALQES